MILGMKVSGLKEFRSNMKEAKGALRSNVRQAMGVIVQELAGEAQRHITGSRKTNPPEVLGVVSGRLKQSITGRVRGAGAGEIVGEVGPQRVVYAAIHEFGGVAGHAHIRARPYLSPALDRMLPRIHDLLGDALEASVSRGGVTL